MPRMSSTAEGHQLVGGEEEDHRDDGEDQHHDRRDHGLAPRRPSDLRRFRPYLLEKGEGIGRLGRHLPLCFRRPVSRAFWMIPMAGTMPPASDPRNPRRISAFRSPMHFGRVKPASQLHAPRVCRAYIKPILRPRKWRRSALLSKRRHRNHPIVPSRLWRLIAKSRHQARAGRGSRARTCDLRFWRPPLYQLSYTPMPRITARQALPKDFRRFCKEWSRQLIPICGSVRRAADWRRLEFSRAHSK